jgi:ribonuclease E
MDDVAERGAVGVAGEGAVDDAAADDRGAAAPETAEKKTVGAKTSGAKTNEAEAAREKTDAAESGDTRRADATKTKAAGASAAAPRTRDDDAGVGTGADARETDVAAEASPATDATDTAAPDTADSDTAAPDTADLDTARAAAEARSSGPVEAGATTPAEEAVVTGAPATRQRPDAGQPAQRQGADAKNVTVLPGVPRYHDAHCILIRFMGEDDIQRMPLSEATAAGCTPCRACQPDNAAE